MKLPLVLVFSLAVLSCNEQRGWTEDNKLSYIQSCISDNRGIYGAEQVKGYCDCVQSRVQRNFPDYRDVEKISMAENSRIADSCAPKGWSKDEEAIFMETCSDKRVSMGDERQVAVRYCDCMMRKIQSKYPNILTTTNIPNEEMAAMAGECLTAAGPRQ
ncbi:MAG TPA: hypothetical protein VEB63_07210 [Chitinophagaceae bacterium]|nr:hypothetical protein [Chitinophagaceae bacterium]